MSLLRPSSFGGGRGGPPGGRSSQGGGGGPGGDAGIPVSGLDDSILQDYEQQPNMFDDDDNAADAGGVEEMEMEDKEDPLLLAIDDLEGRVVAALDDAKLHPGVKTSDAYRDVHEELASLLQPVVEVAAHTAPSIARTYHHGIGDLGVEQSVDDVYERVVSDLVLPVLLEMAQSETIPTKRCAALEFFKHLWKEVHKAGSWLDSTTADGSSQQGPYGTGGSSGSGHSSHHGHGSSVGGRATLQRRQAKRLAREFDFLRYWVQASIACTVPGVFTSATAETSVASRGILAAAASLRPSLWHIATKIKDADDRGANRLYMPVMKMIEGVLKQLFLTNHSMSENANGNEALVSACIKFLEIVVLCCSRKPKEMKDLGGGRGRSRGGGTGVGPGSGGGPAGASGGKDDFSLEDLPAGHPIITREALELIAEYAFTTLRGLTMMGGQIKMDVNLLSDLMLSTGDDSSSPSAQVLSILKPAALAYLEIDESTLPKLNAEDVLEYTLERSNYDYDFTLAQKSYTLTINAMAALAINRPVYFQEAAVCLARRAVQPPVASDNLTHPASKALVVQLKASCLTLLRNVFSVQTNVSGILHKALVQCDMEVQADKALKMAQQTNSLKTANRAARNRANLYYEWDASTDASGAGGVGQKRLRETDDALAQMRKAKAARGLGHGIQLPTSMADAVDLILANLKHLPTQKPKSSDKTSKARKVPVTLDFVVDAVLTNGASLWQEEGRWYDRDGGTAWIMNAESDTNENKKTKQQYKLGSKLLEILGKKGGSVDTVVGADSSGDDDVTKRRRLFQDQCHSAAADAISRIVNSSCYNRSKFLANFGNRVAARLAFTLRKVQPAASLQTAYKMAKESAKDAAEFLKDDEKLQHSLESLTQFVDQYPHVVVGLVLDATPGANSKDLTDVECPVSGRFLNDAFLRSGHSAEDFDERSSVDLYDNALVLWVASTVWAGKLANAKPSDHERKRMAARSAINLQREITNLPRLTRRSLLLISSMCDVEEITKKAADASKKTSQDSIAASAAAHASKVAAEKRATAALLVLRDAAFQRDHSDTRRNAVECAVALASGRLPSTSSIQDKALKLTANVLYARNGILADFVLHSATEELEYFSKLAVESYEDLRKANNESEKDENQKNNPLAPQSEQEKEMMNKMRKPAVLYMALCVRRPDLIESLFRLSSVDKADVLSKTVRVNMSKLARACAAKHGSAEIAMRVAAMSSKKETPLLLSFLECLAPGSEKNDTEAEIIEACYRIQDIKTDDGGRKDPRYIIPVVPVMLRKDLVTRLPEFVASEDKIFLAALERMGHRLQRQALLFRDEQDEENPSLHGMTLCEELVYLHKLDFTSAGLPQKRYLAAIKLCLEDDEVYNDRIVMSALDHISGTFLAGFEPLPLAFMRTVILTCTKHESLHSWICHVLLPRLVEGKIYEDARQWEGWMRCAHMLEKSGSSSANSGEAIAKLPPEQLMQYKTKWAGK